jgi:hypothetical protein
MAVRLYDEALYEKIQKWIKDPNMRILKPDEVTRLFQVRADLTDDKPLKLPIIALSRDSNIELLSANKKPLTFDGMMKEATDKKTLQINAIPIQIGYQLDIYTRFFEEGDEYLRNFIFNLVNFPKLKITIPYNNTNIEHNANITVVKTVEDNSNIAQKLFPDQFTRWTIKILIQDAYLFSTPYVDNVKMDEEIDIEIE